MFLTNAFPRQVRVIISPACSLPVTHAGSILIRCSLWVVLDEQAPHLSLCPWSQLGQLGMWLPKPLTLTWSTKHQTLIAPSASTGGWTHESCSGSRPSGLRLGHSVLIWMTLNLKTILLWEAHQKKFLSTTQVLGTWWWMEGLLQ